VIPDQWYPIYPAKELSRKPVGIQRMGERLVLWRDSGGGAVAMEDRCPHRSVALSRGKVVGGELQCGYHGFRFDATGRCTAMPCEGRDAKIPAGMQVRRHPVHEEHGLLWMYQGAGAAKPFPRIPWFEELHEGAPGCAAGSFSWPVNFVRSVETNFDIHHTPFVHGNILPGIGTRLDPYTCEVDGERIYTAGELRKEGTAKSVAFRVEFQMPSVTFFEFGKLAFLVADCAIDDDHTWRYAVYQQRYLRIPGLAYLGAWLSLQLDWKWIQAKQDLRMAETFTPKLPEDGLDRLVHADAGTAAYRKLRRKLLAEAEQTPAPDDAALRRVS
jgi:phenylpropionate dioxygenase-like ring-hydroxylating dioxygenase large terminal subunit